MRTTLELDDRLHAAARRIAFEQRRSLGEVVSELALRGLQHGDVVDRPVRQLGSFTGLIHIADDFDATPPEVAAAVDEPLA